MMTKIKHLAILADVTNLCQNFCEIMVKFAKIGRGSRAVQKFANLVDLESVLQNEYSLEKIGFDRAVSGPSKIMFLYLRLPLFLNKCSNSVKI